MFFHPRSRKGKQHNQRKTSLPGRSRCGSRAGRCYFIRENVENQSGEALLDLGQVGQIFGNDQGLACTCGQCSSTRLRGDDIVACLSRYFVVVGAGAVAVHLLELAAAKLW